MRIAAAAIALATLAACGPAPGGPPPASGPSPDAVANAAFRLEATMTNDAGQPSPVVMLRDGGKMRIEMNSDEGPVIIIANEETNESYVIMGMGGQRMAMKGAASDVTDQGGIKNMFKDFTADGGATRIGNCTVAGETGGEWQRTDDGVVSAGCVTNDGVILRGTTNGQVQWEATRVARGPQPADQFELPAGVQVMDMGALGDAMSKMQSGQ
jgi:hypothetical protein